MIDLFMRFDDIETMNMTQKGTKTPAPGPSEHMLDMLRSPDQGTGRVANMADTVRNLPVSQWPASWDINDRLSVAKILRRMNDLDLHLGKRRSLKMGHLPRPSHSGPNVESLCDSRLPFSTLLDLHMRLLAGKAPNIDLRWSNIETAKKMEVSLNAFIGWRMGNSLPAPFQLEGLVGHLLLSSPPGRDASRLRSAHPHATQRQVVAIEATLREAYNCDPLPRPRTPPPDPILVSGRAEFANWLRERGLTMREIGERLDVSRSAIAPLLQGRQSRLTKESKRLAPCLEALLAWSTEPMTQPASCWPFPVSIPAKHETDRGANPTLHSPATKPLTPL